MCGLWAFINLKGKNLKMAELYQDFWQLQHRGPDNSYFETYKNVIIGFHRLAIIDDTFVSNQPFVIEDDTRTVVFVCNGEIYNYKEIATKYNLSTLHGIASDCYVIPQAYMTMSKYFTDNDFNRFVKEDIKGEFAFMLFEFDRLKNLRKVIVARDEIGIRPLYYSPDTVDTLLFSSEIKGCLSHKNTKISEFPPGNVYTYTIDELVNVTLKRYDFKTVYDQPVDYMNSYVPETIRLNMIQKSVLNSVRRRLSADKPFAFLLSGGVDSSLVAGLSAKILGKPIRTFCCGIAAGAYSVDGGTSFTTGEGTDMKFARRVAEHIGSTHTDVFFTPQEGVDAIPDVIRTIESWDTTSVRASVGQYLVSKWIGTNTDCKVVMVGEGPDEVCSSYLFNWYAPSGEELNKCAVDYVKNIHYYDVKRADRCISRWGLEGRVPLLDPEFIETYWKIPAERRMPTYKNMEKWWLREAFQGVGVLPGEVLWRKKEAFSDGVSAGEKSWFQIIQDWVSSRVSNEEMACAAEKYPYCTPATKEAYYYRKIFCDIFGEERQTVIPGYWQPKWTADGKEITEYIDPSARVLDVYSEDLDV